VACQRLRIVFCGRPWITFQVELDAAGRVREVGPLSVTSD
jgi:hypothetical protein